MSDPERAADRLAAALTTVMRPVAQTSDRVVSTAATPEQVDLVVELGALARQIVEHNRRVMACEPANWPDLADELVRLTNCCRRQVVIQESGIGVSGGRPSID